MKKEWLKPDTFALMEEKRNCERHSERYKDLKRHVRSRLRRDRTDHLMNICQEANEHAERNRSKELFETVNRLTKKTCPTVRVIKDENGQT